MKSVHVQISGRVQGVWFRAWTCQQADLHGLTGWVRNLRDGRVEAVFCGPEGDVDTMLAQCREGPPMAVVDNVVVTPCDSPDGGDFQSLSTA